MYESVDMTRTLFAYLGTRTWQPTLGIQLVRGGREDGSSDKKRLWIEWSPVDFYASAQREVLIPSPSPLTRNTFPSVTRGGESSVASKRQYSCPVRRSRANSVALMTAGRASNCSHTA